MDALGQQLAKITRGCSEIISENELRKKFSNEVGLNESVIREITPLALVRELLRGGKPQLFYLIDV